MSKFNTVSRGTKVINHAGGDAHQQTAELELVSILLTSFAGESFYESANDTFTRLKELISKCDKKFVAQAAVYARAQFGMRSITHLVAGELAKHAGGTEWGKAFYDAIVYRPDDMMEIIAYYNANCADAAKSAKRGKKTITGAMKAGIAKAFDKFDAYALGKYRGEGKGFKLIDVVNLVHPVPVETNREAIEALVKGELRSIDTWETELTKAGQAAGNEKEKAELKRKVWEKLISQRKIGYFALLRNLRNIIEQAPGIIDEAMKMLTDEKLIKKSLVMPFRFMVAYEEIAKLHLNDSKIVRTVLQGINNAINNAVDISINNIPVFDGDTLIVLDVSQSMREGDAKPAKIGVLFTAALAKSNNADIITFDRKARYVQYNPSDSTLTLTKQIHFEGDATDFRPIFNMANKKYDRVIILSDMQGWVGEHTPAKEYAAYKKRTSADPFIYSFDLKGYGTMQFPERNVFAIAGFSDKVFDIMKLMEADKNALVNTIKKINFAGIQKDVVLSE